MIDSQRKRLEVRIRIKNQDPRVRFPRNRFRSLIRDLAIRRNYRRIYPNEDLIPSEIDSDLFTNLAIFLLFFIKLSLFFARLALLSWLHFLAIHAERERGQRSGPPKLARDPMETVKFESCGGVRLPYELGREPERLLPVPDCPSTIKLTFINV